MFGEIWTWKRRELSEKSVVDIDTCPLVVEWFQLFSNAPRRISSYMCFTFYRAWKDLDCLDGGSQR